MERYVLPILYTLFLWWFSTISIMFLHRLPQRTFRWSFVGATLLLVVSLWGLVATRNDTSVFGAYAAFTCGIVAFGWQLTGFYLGFITGRRLSQPVHQTTLMRFLRAVYACLYHELTALVTAAVIVVITWDSTNQIGMWTFLVLWGGHQSAKLNVFFGVRNFSDHLLPARLQWIRAFVTRKPMNPLFPVSMAVLIVIAALLIDRAIALDVDTFHAVGFSFLSVLTILAIFEHWLLMLPEAHVARRQSVSKHDTARLPNTQVVSIPVRENE